MQQGMKQQDLAVACGYWPLFRYNPAMRDDRGEPVRAGQPAADACRSATTPTTKCATARWRRPGPEDAEQLLAAAQAAIAEKYRLYEEMAGWSGQRFQPAGVA